MAVADSQRLRGLIGSWAQCAGADFITGKAGSPLLVGPSQPARTARVVDVGHARRLRWARPLGHRGGSSTPWPGEARRRRAALCRIRDDDRRRGAVQPWPGRGGADSADIPGEMRETGVGLVLGQKKTERLDLGRYRDGFCFSLVGGGGVGGRRGKREADLTGFGGKVGNEGRGGCKGRHDNTRRDAVRVKFGRCTATSVWDQAGPAANPIQTDSKPDTRDESQAVLQRLVAPTSLMPRLLSFPD